MYQGKKIVFMFSGQGSQFLEMGEELYNTNPRFKYYMDYLDNMFFFHTNISFVNEVYKKKNSDLLFDDVGFGCVMLFAVQYSLAKVLIENEVVPDLLLGTSLGEFVALAVSGAIEPESLMMYVYRVTSHIKSRILCSGMLTVAANINKNYINDIHANCYGSIGAFNHDDHFVISASTEDLQCLEKHYKKEKILTFLLPTKVGFHNNKLIQPFKESCTKYLEQLSIKKPIIDVLSCSTARKVDCVNGEYLFDILAKPIRFSDAMKQIETSLPIMLMDLGPMGTLEGFSKRIFKSDLVSTYGLMKIAGDNLDSFLCTKVI